MAWFGRDRGPWAISDLFPRAVLYEGSILSGYTVKIKTSFRYILPRNFDNKKNINESDDHTGYKCSSIILCRCILSVTSTPVFLSDPGLRVTADRILVTTARVAAAADLVERRIFYNNPNSDQSTRSMKTVRVTQVNIPTNLKHPAASQSPSLMPSPVR